MSSVNVTAREVAAKIVYYGPGLSGKTTNLRKIYDSIKPGARGELVALATEGDRTLFFDFLPVKVERIRDYTLRLGLYTVPGQVFYNATRKLVLQGADGVVFVADSQPDAQERNQESLENLVENLRDEGIDIAEFPLVFQFNKRDLSNLVPVEKLHNALNRWAAPVFESSATEGRGVLEVLKAVTRLVIRDLKAKGVVGRADSGSFVSAVPGLSPSATLEAQVEEHLRMRLPDRTELAAEALDRETASELERRAIATSPLLGDGLVRTVLPADDDVPQVWEPQDVGPATKDGSPTSFLVALAPQTLRTLVLEAEAAFAASAYERTVNLTLQAIRGMTGGRTDDALVGYLLGLEGPLLRQVIDASEGRLGSDGLSGGGQEGSYRRAGKVDAAKALFLLAQACLRVR